ncbi:MAG: tetratricopeptide repeat protein [Chlorobi bacterium]|nr:tetratricopeptide repeat protein [Chlorobiota bacterium]
MSWNNTVNDFPFQRLLVTLLLIVLVIGFFSTQALRGQEWSEYQQLDSIYTVDDRAWDSLRYAVDKDSANLQAWLELIHLCKKRSDFDNELLFATLAVRHTPDSARALYSLADACLNNGLVEDALVPLRTALTIEPRYVKALTVLAEAYDMLYQHDSAVMYLDSAIICNPRNVQAHFQKAELLYRIGQRVESIESYREWAVLQPYKAEPWIKLGEVQCLIGDYEDALESLNYAFSLAPDVPEVLFLVATAKQGLGKRDEARDAFRDFFFRFPTHKRALEAEELARALGWKPGE